MHRIDLGPRNGYAYSLFNVDETVMISVIEGVQAQRRRFLLDSVKPEFQDPESREFILDHLRQLNEFLRETSKLIALSEDGSRLEIK